MPDEYWCGGQVGDDLRNVASVVVEVVLVEMLLALAGAMSGEVDGMAVITEAAEVRQEIQVPAAGMDVAAVDEDQGRVPVGFFCGAVQGMQFALFQ